VVAIGRGHVIIMCAARVCHAMNSVLVAVARGSWLLSCIGLGPGSPLDIKPHPPPTCFEPRVIRRAE
jgi:hypothetical protein